MERNIIFAEKAEKQEKSVIWEPMDNCIFSENEVERAEAIIKALDGLTIASANRLLKRMEDYILLTHINSI